MNAWNVLLWCGVIGIGIGYGVALGVMMFVRTDKLLAEAVKFILKKGK